MAEEELTGSFQFCLMLSFSSLLIWDFPFQLAMSQFSSVIALGSDDTPIAPGNQTLREYRPPPSSGHSGIGEVMVTGSEVTINYVMLASSGSVPERVVSAYTMVGLSG